MMVVPSHDTRCEGALPFRSFRRCILLTFPHRPYERTPTSPSSRILSHSLTFSPAFYSYLLSPHHTHTPNLERKLAKHPVSLAASPLQHGQWVSNHDIPYFNLTFQICRLAPISLLLSPRLLIVTFPMPANDPTRWMVSQSSLPPRHLCLA
jgi:hypothetical protein